MDALSRFGASVTRNGAPVTRFGAPVTRNCTPVTRFLAQFFSSNFEKAENVKLGANVKSDKSGKMKKTKNTKKFGC